MDQRSLLSTKWKSLRTIKMPPGLSARNEPSTVINSMSKSKAGSKSQKIFTTVKLLPEDSFGIRQVTSREFDEAMRKSTEKKFPVGGNRSRSTARGVKQAPSERERRGKGSQVQLKASETTPTTMTGLPWSVRNRMEGKLEAKSSHSLIERPTLGNYTFTYGLTKEDEALLRGEIPVEHYVKPQIKDKSFYKSNIPKTWSHDQDEEDSANAVTADDSKTTQELNQLHKKKLFLHEYQVAQRRVESKNLISSTRNILRQTGLMPSSIDDDMISYYQDLERMEHKFDPEAAFKVTEEERKEAINAFSAPVVKQSRIQPKTYYEVRRRLESTRDMLNSKKKVRILTESAENVSVKPEPPLRLFTPSFTIGPDRRELLIEKQLQKEEEMSDEPMQRVDYDRRKRELMEAALQVYDPETQAYEEAMNAASEKASDTETMTARDETEMYFYNTLTEKFQMDEGSGPKTTLHMSALPNFTLDNLLQPRPLDKFKGPIVGTVLREIEADRNGAERYPIYTKSKFGDKLGKERIKGLRALENYHLSKARQRTIHHKPVIELPKLSDHYDETGVPKNWPSGLDTQGGSRTHPSRHTPTTKSIAPTLYQTQEYMGLEAIPPLFRKRTPKEEKDNVGSLVPSRGSLHSVTFQTPPRNSKSQAPRKGKMTAAKKKLGKASTLGRKDKR